MMPVMRIRSGRNWLWLHHLSARMRRTEAPLDRGGTRDEIAAAQRQDPPRFRERRVVTDQQPDATDRRVDDGPAVTGRGPASLVVREMRLAVDRDVPIRRDKAGAVVEDIAGAFGQATDEIET